MSAGVNGKNRSRGESEKFQIKYQGGLWLQCVVDMLALAFWARKDRAVGSFKEGMDDV